MNTEPVKVTFQVHRDLSDYRKPRYMAKLGKRVVADGRTIDEVREKVADDLGPWMQPNFLIVVE